MVRYGGFRSGDWKVRRKVAGTALAAAAMAALTASQAPGVEVEPREQGKERPDDAQPDNSPGDDSYHTELPPLESPAPPRSQVDEPSESGIPASVLAAYKKAARSMRSSDPACGLRWELLAAIGKVESGQARGGAVDKSGTTLKPILGPVLNGKGFARITDTDGGRLDGDERFDRAVGPMQFIPSTWARWSADGNGDGERDPDNIHDAALAAAGYLCAGERDLRTKAGLDRAILSYNDSQHYLRTVLAWYEFYRKGAHEVPDGSGALPDSPGAGASGGSGKDSAGSGSGSGKPGRPGKPGKGDGAGGGDEAGGGDGPGDESPEPGTPTALKPLLAGEPKAFTGGTFEDRFRVRAVDGSGEAVDGVRVTYTIKGSTGARFPGGARQVTVTTGSDGAATAPAVTAGKKAGDFTVAATATADGHDLRAATMDATVTPKYTFAPASEGPLKATAGSKFPGVEVELAHQKEPAGGVPVTATMVGDDGEENTEGPYFQGLLGKDRSITKSTGGGLLSKKGVLDLPAIHAGDETGTFTLRLTTADGSSYDLKLKVTGG